MVKRISIVLDDDLTKKLHEKQSKLIKESLKSVSFSSVVNQILRKSFKWFKNPHLTQISLQKTLDSMKFCCYTKMLEARLIVYYQVRDHLDYRQPITKVDRLMSDNVILASIILEIFNLIKSKHILTNENHHLTQISLQKTQDLMKLNCSFYYHWCSLVCLTKIAYHHHWD